MALLIGAGLLVTLSVEGFKPTTPVPVALDTPKVTKTPTAPKAPQTKAEPYSKLTDINRAGRLLTLASAAGVMAFCKANVAGYVPGFELQDVLNRLVPLSDEFKDSTDDHFKELVNLTAGVFNFSRDQGLLMTFTPKGGVKSLDVVRTPVTTVEGCKAAEKTLTDETITDGMIPGKLALKGRGAALEQRLPPTIRSS